MVVGPWSLVVVIFSLFFGRCSFSLFLVVCLVLFALCYSCFVLCYVSVVLCGLLFVMCYSLFALCSEFLVRYLASLVLFALCSL